MNRLTLALVLGIFCVTAPASAIPPTPILPSADTVQDRQSFRAFIDCLATARPNWGRRLLAQPYLSKEQQRSAGDALSGRDKCLGDGDLALTFRTASVVSNLAEHFIRAELGSADTERLARTLNTISPLNASEDFALCVAARDPVSARDLTLSVPGSESENRASQRLAAFVPACLNKEERPTVDLLSLRGLMSIALYRAITSISLAKD